MKFQKGDYAKLEKLQYLGSQNAGYLGRHILAEFFGCNPNVLNNVELIQEKMTQAAVECGATVVQTCFHMFNPYGVSGVVIISESHLAIHTWPELGYAAVDLFTCGEHCDPKVAYDFLKKAFDSKSGSFSQLKRGILSEDHNHLMTVPFKVEQQKIEKPAETLEQRI